MVVVAVGLGCAGRVGGGPCLCIAVCVGGGTVSYLSDLSYLHMYLEQAREDYQHARTFCSATGVRYTPECIERKRRRVVELEAAVEAAQ